MKVLAFDPGYGRTGWAVIESCRMQPGFRHCAYGVIETSSALTIGARLAELHEAAYALLSEYLPDHLVMEKLFFGRNLTTAAGVYQAQGVLLALAGSRQLGVLELSPSSIKSAIAGGGRADKAQIQLMVRRLLGIDEAIRPDDAADALAGAIAGFLQLRGAKALTRVVGGWQ
ncbi:MAG: crossover junction endodeoxyribonuclease RuvC [Leptospirales bacterium]|nr:crossover junction endodeoxyribonuclease RuvC [Leptospirales bacterium]